MAAEAGGAEGEAGLSLMFQGPVGGMREVDPSVAVLTELRAMTGGAVLRLLRHAGAVLVEPVAAVGGRLGSPVARIAEGLD